MCPFDFKRAGDFILTGDEMLSSEDDQVRGCYSLVAPSLIAADDLSRGRGTEQR